MVKSRSWSIHELVLAPMVLNIFFIFFVQFNFSRVIYEMYQLAFLIFGEDFEPKELASAPYEQLEEN